MSLSERDGFRLRAVVGEVWTRDACGGTNLALVPEGPHPPEAIACWDEPGGHHSYWSLRDMPPPSDLMAATRWMEDAIRTLLRHHRQPYNRLLGTDLPAVDEATYFDTNAPSRGSGTRGIPKDSVAGS